MMRRSFLTFGLMALASAALMPTVQPAQAIEPAVVIDWHGYHVVLCDKIGIGPVIYDHHRSEIFDGPVLMAAMQPGSDASASNPYSGNGLGVGERLKGAADRAVEQSVKEVPTLAPERGGVIDARAPRPQSMASPPAGGAVLPSRPS